MVVSASTLPIALIWIGTSCWVTLAISTGTISLRPGPGALVADWLTQKRHNKTRSRTRTRTLTICTIRARVRRGRLTLVIAGTRHWLAPVAGPLAWGGRGSLLGCLVSALQTTLQPNKTRRA